MNLPIVNLPYPNWREENVEFKDFYVLGKLKPEHNPRQVGEYSELCELLQEYINADCHAITVSYYETPVIEVCEILYSAYSHKVMNFRHRIQDMQIRESLSNSIHGYLLCDIINKNIAQEIRIYMFGQYPYTINVIYNPSSGEKNGSFHIDMNRSKEFIEFVEKCKLNKEEQLKKEALGAFKELEKAFEELEKVVEKVEKKIAKDPKEELAELEELLVDKIAEDKSEERVNNLDQQDRLKEIIKKQKELTEKLKKDQEIHAAYKADLQLSREEINETENYLEEIIAENREEDRLDKLDQEERQKEIATLTEKIKSLKCKNLQEQIDF